MFTPKPLFSQIMHLDLVSTIKKWHKRYKRSHFSFSSDLIYLKITKMWMPERYIISAAAFCSDPEYELGLSRSLFINFYVQGNFKSYEQASTYLLEQGIRASQEYVNINLYIPQDEDNSMYLHIVGGNVVDETSNIVRSQPCFQCGTTFVGDVDSICPVCQQPKFSWY